MKSYLLAGASLFALSIVYSVTAVASDASANDDAAKKDAVSLNAADALTDTAKDAAGEEVEQEVEEIMVIGQKSAKSLQEVAASVSVETGAEIEREPLTDLFDIVIRVPNVTASFGEQGFAIRGIDQRGVSGSGLTLTVYVDDAPLSNQTTFFGPTGSWDLGQVEVYRGPQSTNFGRNTLAGAIYVRTKDPSFEPELKARMEVGSDGQLWGAVAGGGAIIDDVLAFRVSADYRESDGFITNTFLEEDADATELWNVRGKLLFQPTENLKIITTSSYTENFAGEDLIRPFSDPATAMTLSAGDVVQEVAYDTPGREGTETFIQSVNVEWQINDVLSFQSITSYQDTTYVRQEDFDVTPAPIAALDRSSDDQSFTEELRLRYDSDALSVAFGAYYADLDTTFFDDFTVPGSILNSAIPAGIFIERNGINGSETKNYALFFDGEYAVTDKIDLLFGLRWDDEEQQDTTRTETTLVGDIPPGFEFLLAFEGTEAQETEASFNAWLPKGGIRFSPSDDVVLSFVAQRAYRAGGADVNFVDPTQLIEFGPEYLWNFELSSRVTLWDGRAQWNTNVFYADWQDQQVAEQLEPPFEAFSRTVNAGKSELYGFESDVTVNITEEVNVYAGVGYTKTEFIDFPIEDGGNLAGNTFPSSPEFSLNAGIDYRGESGIFGGIDANYQSSAFANQFNDDFTGGEARTLINARIGYAITENISASVFVRNLLDEQYFAFFNRSLAGNGARLGDPLTWAFRLDVNF